MRHLIGAVMKWAVAQGYRDDNAEGDGISAALSKTGTVRKHLRDLPFAAVSAALDKVMESGPYRGTASALQLLVLTG